MASQGPVRVGWRVPAGGTRLVQACLGARGRLVGLQNVRRRPVQTPQSRESCSLVCYRTLAAPPLG